MGFIIISILMIIIHLHPSWLNDVVAELAKNLEAIRVWGRTSFDSTLASWSCYRIIHFWFWLEWHFFGLSWYETWGPFWTHRAYLRWQPWLKRPLHRFVWCSNCGLSKTRMLCLHSAMPWSSPVWIIAMNSTWGYSWRPLFRMSQCANKRGPYICPW